MALVSAYQLPLFPHEKRCTKCDQVKPLTEFYRDRHAPDGLRRLCKDCAAASQRRWREREHDAVIAKSRAKYYEDVEASRAYKRAWDAAHAESVRSSSRRYYRAHAEREIAQAKAYGLAHIEWRRERDRAYYYKHREERNAKSRITCKRHYQQNKDAYIIKSRNRRLLRKGAEGTHTKDDLDAIYAAQHGRCYYCGVTLAKPIHVDHKQPLSRGGTNWPDNLALTCAFCNLSKHNSTEAEFRARLQRPELRDAAVG